MTDETLNSFSLTLDFLRCLVADVPDEAMARQPAGVANHPAWTLGHLAHSCEAIAGELGVPPWLPAEWSARFGTGSVPTADRGAYPSKADLLAALDDGKRRLAARLRAMSDAGLGVPLPDERYRNRFPTLGHAVIHILGAHTAAHVGQVTVWRRAAGFGPPAEPFI